MLNQDREQGLRADSRTELVLSKGSWGRNISWEFVVSSEKPDTKLCTAVCCVTTFNNKLLLVRNKRGWEIPAGHIENEAPEQAVIREVQEETGALIPDPRFFGYKRLTAAEPVAHPGLPDSFYPYPISYVAFFHAEATGLSRKPLGLDVQKVFHATFTQAQEVLRGGGQYTNVLEYLQEKGLIRV